MSAGGSTGPGHPASEAARKREESEPRATEWMFMGARAYCGPGARGKCAVRESTAEAKPLPSRDWQG